MNSEEFVNGGNEDGGEEIVNSNGNPFVAQKDQEILELKQKISSLEAERDDLQSLVEEQASKMMSAIESGDASKRRAAEAESRLEEASQQLAEANSSLKYLEEEEFRMLKSVVQLQHDLISVMKERDAILAELKTMSAYLEDTRKASDLKDSTIKSLEDERDSLRERAEGQDRALDAFMKQLEETLSDANSKLEAEKRALDEGNKKLMGIEMQSKMQEEKIKELETRLKQSEIERERASQAYMEKEERHHELSPELEELGSQLEKSLNEKRLIEDQLGVGKLQSKREIEALEKDVAELSAKHDSVEAEGKELIVKLGCSGNGASKSLPSQEHASGIQWPMFALASTGTLAAAAFMAHLKYSRLSDEFSLYERLRDRCSCGIQRVIIH